MESGNEDENQESGENIIIAAEYDDEYDPDDYRAIRVTSPQTLSAHRNNISVTGGNKSKYYKQTYRAAWEHMPDFKGWLRGVSGEPTRAYCVYCQKTLHAHRLSLLKHTCTIRHQKAAQMHNNRKGKPIPVPTFDTVTFVEGHSSTQEDEDPELEHSEIVHAITSNVMEEDEQENEEDIDEDVEEEEEPMTLVPHMQFQKQFRQQQLTQSISSVSNNNKKAAISTHVMDTSTGTPVNGLQVSLYKLIDGRWTYINEGTTNNDGRFANFMQDNDLTTGRYKLHYDVDRYFETKKQTSLYPFIEIVFDCRAQGETYHIPLLLSAFGYTTYRGS